MFQAAIARGMAPTAGKLDARPLSMPVKYDRDNFDFTYRVHGERKVDT
jgi:hypothetical protein